MTCDDYLAMLETLPVEELMHGEARDHAGVCRDCNRVTRVVAERERNMILAYGDVMPSTAAVSVAQSAIATVRRRRVAKFYTTALAAVGVVAVVALVTTRGARIARVARVRREPALSAGAVEQAFPLRCLSAGRAASLVRANIPDRLHTRLVAREPEGVLIVTGTPPNLEVARSVLDEYDMQCVVPPPTLPR